jgi:hypothetical protein
MMLFRNKVGTKLLLNSYLLIKISLSIIQAIKRRDIKFNFSKRIIIVNIVLVVMMLITSHTLSIKGSTWAWRRIRKLRVLIIVNPLILSEWITVNMCVSCCNIWVSRHIRVSCRNWQLSLQGLDSVSHNRNTMLHPLKCCFSGCLGLVEHLVQGRSSLIERLVHGRGQ